MTLGFVTRLRNARLDAITTDVGASGKLRLYSGTRPATGGAITTLLAELTLNATLAPAASGGVLTLNAITGDSSADATGTATWGRIFRSDGTTICVDLSVTATGGGGDIQLNTASLVAGAAVTVTSATITEGNP